MHCKREQPHCDARKLVVSGSVCIEGTRGPGSFDGAQQITPIIKLLTNQCAASLQLNDKRQSKGADCIIIRLQAQLVLIIKLALSNGLPPTWLLRSLFSCRRNEKHFAKAVAMLEVSLSGALMGAEHKEHRMTQADAKEDKKNIREWGGCPHSRVLDQNIWSLVKT